MGFAQAALIILWLLPFVADPRLTLQAKLINWVLGSRLWLLPMPMRMSFEASLIL